VSFHLERHKTNGGFGGKTGGKIARPEGKDLQVGLRKWIADKGEKGVRTERCAVSAEM